MMLSQRIAAELERLGTETPDASITAEEGSLQFLLDIRQAGPVGLAIREVRLRNADARWSMDDLRARGEQIAAKVTYLMEPLKLVEADAIAQEIELRSADPTKRIERSSFYQAKLTSDGQFSLRRIAFGVKDRQRVPADIQLTGETLERLADDLADCLR